MQEKSQKRLMTALARGITIAMSSRLADKLIDVPERPGIKDDIKEAVLKAAFTVAGAAVASVLVRSFIRQ